MHVLVACFVGILAGSWVVAFNAFAFALELIAAVKRLMAGCLHVHLELQRGQIERKGGRWGVRLLDRPPSSFAERNMLCRQEVFDVTYIEAKLWDYLCLDYTHN